MALCSIIGGGLHYYQIFMPTSPLPNIITISAPKVETESSVTRVLRLLQMGLECCVLRVFSLIQMGLNCSSIVTVPREERKVTRKHRFITEIPAPSINRK